jgi:hypothetical protein
MAKEEAAAIITGAKQVEEALTKLVPYTLLVFNIKV